MPRARACSAACSYTASAAVAAWSKASPHRVRACSAVMFVSWPLVALKAGVTIGAGRRSASRSPGGSVDARDRAGRLVVEEARAREVAAHDELDRAACRACARACCARAGRRPASSPGMSSTRSESRWFGTMCSVSREPEGGDPGEHAPLVRDRRRQHDVERRDPVGGDQQQLAVARVVQLAHLARAEMGQLRHGRSPRRGPRNGRRRRPRA